MDICCILGVSVGWHYIDIVGWVDGEKVEIEIKYIHLHLPSKMTCRVCALEFGQ